MRSWLIALLVCTGACEQILGFERGIPAGTLETDADAGNAGAGGEAETNREGGIVPPADSASGGGAAGEGAGGAGECDSNDDCDNPEPARCEARCNAHRCSVGARDTDRDQHRDQGCTVDPGDDCDDQRADVHPGAEELCDGLDNDCDGEWDLAEGLTLAGGVQPLGSGVGRYPEIAFSSGTSVYGAAWQAGSLENPTIAFAVLDLQGNALGAPTMLEPHGVRSMQLVAGDGKFGLIWCDADYNFYLQLILADGTPAELRLMNEEPSLGTTARLAYTDTGGWAAFWTRFGGDVVGRRLSRAGVLGPVVTLVTSIANDMIQARASDDAILLTYANIAAQPEAVLLSPLLFVVGEPAPPGGVFVAGENGFGAVFLDKKLGWIFRELDADARLRCGPIPISGGVSDIAPSLDGYLIVTSNGLVEMRAGCDERQTAEFGASGGHIAAAGSDGFTVVWQEGADQIRRRTFGPHLCD